MTARAAWIRVDVRSVNDGRVLVFSDPNTDRGKVEVEVEESDLEKARAEASGAIVRFREAVGGEPRPKGAAAALQELHDDMFTIATGTMASYRKLVDLREFLDVPRGWWNRQNAPVRVVEVVGRDDGFPFELLPLFDHRPITRGRALSRHELRKSARRFLGFTCVVRRLGRQRVATGPPLSSRPLNVSLMRHASLEGVRIEEEYFVKLGPQVVALDGPWPGPELDEDHVINGVGDALFDGRHRLIGPREKRMTQIHHFACHCVTDGDPLNDALVLAATGTGHRVVPLKRIVSGYGERDMRLRAAGEADPHDERAGSPPRGLVFLNACGTAAVNPARLTSFPRSFRNGHHRGVIGVETAIPDGAATMYSMCFYRQLLAGDSVGEAMVKARVRLLEEYGNPLGLLYTLYADPDLTVSDPVPEAELATPTLGI